MAATTGMAGVLGGQREPPPPCERPPRPPRPERWRVVVMVMVTAWTLATFMFKTGSDSELLSSLPLLTAVPAEANSLSSSIASAQIGRAAARQGSMRRSMHSEAMIAARFSPLVAIVGGGAGVVALV